MSDSGGKEGDGEGRESMEGEKGREGERRGENLPFKITDRKISPGSNPANGDQCSGSFWRRHQHQPKSDRQPVAIDKERRSEALKKKAKNCGIAPAHTH